MIYRLQNAFSIDALLLSCMALLGICGALVFFTQPDSISLNGISTSQASISPITLHGYKQIHENCLTIGDKHSTAEPVTFKIDHYNRSADYFIDYGDGAAEYATQCEIKHQYTKQGNYQINLFMEYRGQKKLISCKNLNIF